MSTRIPSLGGRERPRNTVVLMREAYLALNDLVVATLTDAGHDAVRPAHAAVFQYLDDTGTTVSTLAERARMTKQAMAELVGHLERHGYLTRVPDPADRRAKLVLPTDRGHDVIAIAQALVPGIEAGIAALLGGSRLDELRRDLKAVREAAVRGDLVPAPARTAEP